MTEHEEEESTQSVIVDTGTSASWRQHNNTNNNDDHHDGVFFFWWTEIQTQCRLSGPMILVSLSQIAFHLISTMFVGHLGELSLSSTAIAISVSNVTGLCIMMGMASCLETLCGQAFGAKQYRTLGIYLQRGLLVLNMTAIPLVFVYAYVGRILASLGQDETISAEAGKYARWLIPTLFAQASIQPLIRFFQTQSLVHPMMLSSAFAVACHVPLCWFLTYRTSFGFQGAALSTSICNWIGTLLLYAYLCLSPSCERTRAPLSWQAFHGMRSFFHLAIPSAAMLCLEWWCYEILVLLSGLLPNPELQTSTFATCLNLATLTFQIPFGLSASVSTRVSNELGGGRGEGAKRAIRVGMCLTITQAAMVSMGYLFGRNVLGRVFSSDEEVVKNVAKMMKLLALSTFLDSTQAVLSGSMDRSHLRPFFPNTFTCIHHVESRLGSGGCSCSKTHRIIHFVNFISVGMMCNRSLFVCCSKYSYKKRRSHYDDSSFLQFIIVGHDHNSEARNVVLARGLQISARRKKLS